MSIKDVRDETPMCSEPLSREHITDATLLFRHVADMVSVSIHNDIFVRLLEATDTGAWLASISFWETSNQSRQSNSHHDIHHF